MRSPRQSRSRRTLERIVEAAERLLADREFEALTVQEIVARAGVSVGAFYARFETKDALLPLLASRYYDDAVEATATRFAPSCWQGAGLARRVEGLFDALLQVAAERRGLLRAIAKNMRADPSSLRPEDRDKALRVLDTLKRHLLGAGDEITHPDPERAVHVALVFAQSTLQEQALLRDTNLARSLDMSLDEVKRELVHAVVAYLTTPIGPTVTEIES